jgi:UDPglucose 6-dehydrogenase
MRISIIGTGYVGLVTGACFAKLGHQVICVDVDPKKVSAINRGQSPIFEEHLDALLTTNQSRIHATDNYQEAISNTEITFLCVGTPSKNDGDIDLHFVKEATQTIAESLKQKPSWHLVVMKSTVLPGTTETIVLPLLEQHSGKTVGNDIGLAMNPEFLREGVAVDDFLKPDRIVIGAYDPKSRGPLTKLYEPFNCPLVHTSLSAAEMIKYASNAFLATKISFINEIGNMCKMLGINTYEVADGVGLDSRIGRAFLDAGIGWGGSCFPKDLDALRAWAKTKTVPSKIINSTVEVNQTQPLKLLELLKKHIPQLKGKTIGILGLAFKPNTDDIRESRSIPIVHQLLKEEAELLVYDPKAMENFTQLFPKLTYCATAEEVMKADIILLLTKWEEFRNLDYTEKLVVDGRNLQEAKNAKIYEGVCW